MITADDISSLASPPDPALNVIDLEAERLARVRETFDDLLNSHSFALAFAKWCKLNASMIAASTVSSHYTCTLKRDDGDYRLSLDFTVEKCTP